MLVERRSQCPRGAGRARTPRGSRRISAAPACSARSRKFRRAIKASGLAASDILAIGDETRDIDAAREVGLGAGAVLWGYANPETLIAMKPDCRSRSLRRSSRI